MGKELRTLPEDKKDYKREIIAGTTSFLAMAYIIAVNPSILSATGMPQGALVTATCLSAAFSCILMGLYAKLPIGLASGMGLNAFFAFSVVIGKGISWDIALTAVFVEGIIFILLSLFKVREAVVDAIPLNLKYAVTGGIGLFIAFVGFNGAGLVVSDESTKVAMGNFFSPTVLIAVIGLIVIVILEKKKVKGSMLIGIVISTVMAWGYAILRPESANLLGINSVPSGIFKFESLAPIAGKIDFSYLTTPENIFNFAVIVLTFLFVDFFDTVGTLVGVASRANMLDKDGEYRNAGKALLVDALGTTAGALMGTSAVTTYVESATGVEEGKNRINCYNNRCIIFYSNIFFASIYSSTNLCDSTSSNICWIFNAWKYS